VFRQASSVELSRIAGQRLDERASTAVLLLYIA
jgi:hypothetical protein